MHSAIWVAQRPNKFPFNEKSSSQVPGLTVVYVTSSGVNNKQFHYKKLFWTWRPKPGCCDKHLDYQSPLHAPLKMRGFLSQVLSLYKYCHFWHTLLLHMASFLVLFWFGLSFFLFSSAHFVFLQHRWCQDAATAAWSQYSRIERGIGSGIVL